MLLTRWGKMGYIVNTETGAKVPAIMARSEYRPQERGLFQDGSERIYVSALASIAPDHESHTLEFNSKHYRILLPVTGPRPDGTVIFYDCNVLEYTPR